MERKLGVVSGMLTPVKRPGTARSVRKGRIEEEVVPESVSSEKPRTRDPGMMPQTDVVARTTSS